jgi:hypothetical protein
MAADLGAAVHRLLAAVSAGDYRRFDQEMAYPRGHIEPWQRHEKFDELLVGTFRKRFGDLQTLAVVEWGPANWGRVDAEYERLGTDGGGASIISAMGHPEDKHRWVGEAVFERGSARVTVYFCPEEEGLRVSWLCLEPQRGKALLSFRGEFVPPLNVAALLDVWWPRFIAETPRELLPTKRPRAWTYTLTPPFPSEWPPPACWTTYAFATVPATGGEQWYEPWARVDVTRSEKQSAVSPMGDCLGRPRPGPGETETEPVTPDVSNLAAITSRTKVPRKGTPAHRVLVSAYRAWRQRYPGLSDFLRPRHAEFLAWLDEP